MHVDGVRHSDPFNSFDPSVLILIKYFVNYTKKILVWK